jgi:hypothetical protein
MRLPQRSVAESTVSVVARPSGTVTLPLSAVATTRCPATSATTRPPEAERG